MEDKKVSEKIANEKIVSEAPQVTPPGPSSAFENVEKITKAVALILAVAYSLGVLISNQYLVTLGVSDFSSLRPKYIITGLWTLALLVFVLLPIYVPIATSEGPKRKNLIRIIGTIAGLVLMVAFTNLLSLVLNADVDLADYVYPVPGHPRTQIPLMIILLPNGGTALLLFYFANMLIDRPRLQRFSYAMSALLSCLVIAFATHIIATHLYVHIPAAAGGGRPITGRLILNKDGEAFWAEARIVGTNKPSELQIPFIDPTITPRSRVAKLYYEDEHIMVIGVDNSHGGEGETVNMILNKSLVDAFLIDRKQ